jgi:PRTRC genetic system protein B
MKTTPILPQIDWEDREFANLKMRLDIFDDIIIASKFNRSRDDVEGRVSAFMVDPLDVASTLAGLDLATGLLPRNCLAWSRQGGQERLVIYIEPRRWDLWVMPTQKANRSIPLPGMVWVGHGKQYAVYAVKEIPTLTTPLFAVPAPNVRYPQGICVGEVSFPVASAATIWAAVEAFFGSGFNNHLENGRSQKYPDGVLKMWHKLHTAQAAEYPLDDLLPLKLILSEVINGQ